MMTTMSACGASAVRPDPDPGGVLYHGPRFLLADGEAEAILVDARGVIANVFSDTSAALAGTPPAVRRERLPGVLALPGLIDAHLHVTWIGRAREQLDLNGARSIAEVAARLEAFAAAHPEIAVIVGHGWDHTLWGSGFPTAADLGALARPAILTRVDGHAVWLNGAAMARARTFFEAPPADAPGMKIERDAHGPTGVVVDPVAALWELISPPPTEAELARWIERGLIACADAGLVEVHDMATSPAELAVMQRLAAGGPLPVRVVVYLDDSAASFEWIAGHRGAPAALGPDLIVAGIKLFADGALGSRGAALKEDYSDHHGHRGLPTGREGLIAKAVRAAELGYPVAIHAIGDLGNDHALAAIEAAREVGAPGLVHRVEHAQVIDLADLDRFVRTGAIASMQPTHATSDMRWAEARVGPERIKGAYAWNTLLHRGIPLAFGSDAPVEREDPLAGLFAAVFRQTATGEPPGGWRPSEALSFAEALAAFTVGAVRAAPGLGRSGRLERGAPFEVTLLDGDVLADPRQLGQAKVLATVRAGHVRMTRTPLLTP